MIRKGPKNDWLDTEAEEGQEGGSPTPKYVEKASGTFS
jgi:hypothetical protein